MDKDIQLLDLVRPRSEINPFLTTDDLLPYWLDLNELLSRIAWALAKPLERDDNPRDYIPSHRLSEFAERVGFDGIRYPSAMDRSGSNLVIFNPTKCTILESKLVKVTDVSLEYSENIWQLTDEFPDQ